MSMYNLVPRLKPFATFFRMMYLKAFELSSLRSQLASGPQGSAYALEGMMEQWNSGMMGSGIMQC